MRLCLTAVCSAVLLPCCSCLGEPHLHAQSLECHEGTSLGAALLQVKHQRHSAHIGCAPGCEAPATALGAQFNGGEELENGICTHFASEVQTNGYRYCGEGPSYTRGDALDCRGCRRSPPSHLEIAEHSASKDFHDIVGGGGVYVLSMGCQSARFQFTAQHLTQVGITPAFFPAVAQEASARELAQGCFDQTTPICNSSQRVGQGCGNSAEQAIAESHRRALAAAMSREAEWTLILEDDAVPVMPEDGKWMQRLVQVWAEIPAGTDVVRLGWCGSAEPVHRWNSSADAFVLADTTSAGCTHAYAVRKSALPKMLKLFPCCCAVDCCYAWGMPALDINVVNVDVAGSKDYIFGHGEWTASDWGSAYGVMMQARKELTSLHETGIQATHADLSSTNKAWQAACFSPEVLDRKPPKDDNPLEIPVKASGWGSGRKRSDEVLRPSWEITSYNHLQDDTHWLTSNKQAAFPPPPRRE